MERLAALFLALFVLAACNRQPAAAPGVPVPAPALAIKHKARRHRPRHEEPSLLPTPREPKLLPEATAEVNVEPSNQHLFEDVAFKDEDEVKAMLGAPDATMTHTDEDASVDSVVSWYYQRAQEGGEGKRVCPEIRFIAGKARFVLFWTPEAMRSLVKDALSAGGALPAPRNQDYSFMDSFRYLGVGTDQGLVLEDLGEPDSKHPGENGTEAWDYDTLIVEDGEPRRLSVFVKGGKVVEVRGRQ